MTLFNEIDRLNKLSLSKYKLGCIPDYGDPRDKTYRAPYGSLKKLPSAINLEDEMPPVYDQGQLGSCTANAIGGNLQFLEMKQKQQDINPRSRLFIYYGERVMENSVGSDSGAMIRDGIKFVNQYGAPDESLWGYDISKFTDKPPQQAYDNATLHKALRYERINGSLNDMKACLSNGFPFIIGFTVFPSMMSAEVAQSGIVPLPSRDENAIGGHAVLVVGYDNSTKRFRVRNSWGTGWGQKGYFEIDYDYFTNPNLSNDIWSIRLTE